MKLVFFLRLSVICVSFMWRFTQIKYCLLACLRSNDERLQTKIEIELHMYTVLHKNKTTLPLLPAVSNILRIAPVSEMTRTVSSGTLNPSIPYHYHTVSRPSSINSVSSWGLRLLVTITLPSP